MRGRNWTEATEAAQRRRGRSWAEAAEVGGRADRMASNNHRHLERTHRRSGGQIIGMLLFILGFCLVMLLGYCITSGIYQYTGHPPELLAHLFSGLVGLLLIVLTLGSIVLIFRRRRGDQSYHARNAVTEALQQISQGNFDVLLDPRSSGFYSELAETINAMAKNLGNLETMREELITNVSHEIQSPLTSIGGFAALLKSEDLSEEDRKRYLDIIEAESKRLSSLSDNLLRLSTLEQDKVLPNKLAFRLDRQIEQIALTLEPQWAAKGLNVEADLQKCTVSGDEDLLSQVWMNLLHNAIKFTPDGGSITIELRVDDKAATVRITDEGVGIAPEDQIHIFERFYKADKARDRSLGGNGLGLSLVKKIVTLHDGSVTVESELGKGTTFEIVLPRETSR